MATVTLRRTVDVTVEIEDGDLADAKLACEIGFTLLMESTQDDEQFEILVDCLHRPHLAVRSWAAESDEGGQRVIYPVIDG